MGSLYRRGSIWWLQYRQHGRLMRESSESTKERVARRMLRAREGDVEHGVLVDPKRDQVTFDEAAEDLLHTGPTGTNVADVVVALRPAW